MSFKVIQYNIDQQITELQTNDLPRMYAYLCFCMCYCINVTGIR